MPAGCTVIKLGGSLSRSPNLRRWLGAIAGLNKPVIVVCGGGPFADTVRQMQPVMGFSDAVGHRMAVLGMTQYAHGLCGLDARFIPAALPDDFGEAWMRRMTPVWTPHVMLDGRDDVPPVWEMTSDSLSAWLAGQVGATRLVLLKSVAPSVDTIAADALAAEGIADKELPRVLRALNVDVVWLGPDDMDKLETAIAGAAGTRIETQRI